MAAVLLTIVTIVPAMAQSRAVRDRYSRSSTYGDVVEIRLNEPGTLEQKMTPEMQSRECLSLAEVQLGNSLISIGDNALRETPITSLVLPETVTQVGKKVAEKCKNLTRIECHAILPPKLDGVSDNKVALYVPATSVNAYHRAKNWKSFKNIQPLE